MTHSTRRSFLKWSAVAAPLAAAAPAAAAQPDGAAERLARLEDMESIRACHDAFLRAINSGDHAVAGALFADPATAEIDPALRRIVLERGAGEAQMNSSLAKRGRGTMRSMVEGANAAQSSQDMALILSEDRNTATLTAACVTQTEIPIEGDSTILQMARLQGDGVVRTAAPRTLEMAFVKTKDGAWRIAGAAFT